MLAAFFPTMLRRATIPALSTERPRAPAFMSHPEYILTLSCLDQRGIVHRVSGFLAEHGCNIIDSAQFGDGESKLFFMRVHFVLEESAVSDLQLRADFAELSQAMQLNGLFHGQLHDARSKPRVM